jgi:hypothetical protein
MSEKYSELAVVVGAAGGIGRELARLLSTDDIHVVLVDADGDGLAEVRTTIVADRLAGTYVADVTNESQVFDLADRISAEIGSPTMLINCVGWARPARQEDMGAQSGRLAACFRHQPPRTDLLRARLPARTRSRQRTRSDHPAFVPGRLLRLTGTRVVCGSQACADCVCRNPRTGAHRAWVTRARFRGQSWICSN